MILADSAQVRKQNADGITEAWQDDASVGDDSADEDRAVVDDEGEEGEAEDSYLDPWDACVDPDAKGAVERWKIVAVGHRPQDYLARDCLYAALLRDRRVPWFRRYLNRPESWMEALVAHLPNTRDRRQALQCVVLDYLHKLHLARLFPALSDPWGEEDEETKLFRRVWRCAPYTVQVVRRNGGRKNVRGCGYARLCPWCHARKVVQLYHCLSDGPMKNPNLEYLFLGKCVPFAEPMGGVDGSRHQADWQDYAGGEVRGHWGRYYGRDPERLARTREVLAKALMGQAADIGLRDGMWTHQLGSAQLENGQRTFLHDVALIAQVDEDVMDRMPRDKEGKVFWGGNEVTGLPNVDAHLEVRWLALPVCKPAALRIALAGSSMKYSVAKQGLPEEWFRNEGGYSTGVSGALSWQPTFLLDDQMWFAYERATRNQKLYRPFGSWGKSLARATQESRTTTDRKFGRAQANRLARDQQQKENGRQAQVAARRDELFKVAQELWPQALSRPTTGKGRPPHRATLDGLLRERGVVASQRDLSWAMSRLRVEREGRST